MAASAAVPTPPRPRPSSVAGGAPGPPGVPSSPAAAAPPRQGWREALHAERERRGTGAGAAEGAKRYKRLAEAACRASEGVTFLRLLEKNEPQSQAARVVLAAAVSGGHSQEALAVLRWQQAAAETLLGTGAPKLASGLRLRVRDYCAVISCLCRGSKDKGSGWLAVEAFQLWRELWASGEVLDAPALRVGMNAAAVAGDMAETENLLRLLVQRSELTADAFHILIKGYGIARETESLRLVQGRMERSGLSADVDTFNSLVAAFVRAGSVTDAEEVVRGVEEAAGGEAAVVPGVRMYTALLQGYATAGDLSQALGILGRMGAHGVRPNAVTYATLAAMAVRSGDARVAETVAQQAKEQGLYSSALHASLLRLTAVEEGAPVPGEAREVRGGSGTGDATAAAPHHVAATTAEGTQWRKGGVSVQRALRKMEDHGLQPSPAAFRALCRTAMTHQDPAGVKHVLKAMRSAGLPPDRSCLTMLIATCAKCGLTEEARNAFAVLRRLLGDRAIDGPAVRALILSFALARSPREAEAAAVEATKAYVNSRESLAGTPSFCPVLGTVPLASDILNAQTYGALARAYCTAEDLPGALGLADRAMRGGHSRGQFVSGSGAKSFSVGPGLDMRGAEAIAELCVVRGETKSLKKYLRNLAQHQRMLQHCQTGYSLRSDSDREATYTDLKDWLTLERANDLVHRSEMKRKRLQDREKAVAAERLKFWFGAPNRYYASLEEGDSDD